MIKEDDYVLIIDAEDENYLQVGRIIEIVRDANNVIRMCNIGFGFVQEINRKKYKWYDYKEIGKFKILAFRE